ncbi:ATP-binding protein [Nocardiopsis sp. HNM0947]|uniref:ATP-binding protein n=1 Tax=Nocardiopsis coralli TaxID=2772213 RepID=A0ABR9P1H9_9ACTN|nr:ATP-binding protein [Nocardiopsis coralli]MBE2997693.1 ATP-binding protein [Nocardiopsis coralli]
MADLPDVTVPLGELVRPRCRHYFTGRSGRAHFRTRRYDFGGSPRYLPLVRAFLNTCAADRDDDYRYLFTLLGSELANNALDHSHSGRPFGVYSLTCERIRDGLRLTCRDQGSRDGTTVPFGQRAHLRAAADGLDLSAESGRGLALIDALATCWGDNGIPDRRQVWFFLAHDLTGSLWGSATAERTGPDPDPGPEADL